MADRGDRGEALSIHAEMQQARRDAAAAAARPPQPPAPAPRVPVAAAPGQRVISKATAQMDPHIWDPRIDDPRGNVADGKPHPEEAAISDPDADHDAKGTAWSKRVDRLIEMGELNAADFAIEHMKYHEAAGQDSTADSKARKTAEEEGREY